MDIVKNAKEIGNEIEKGVELVSNKVSEAFDNLASHLPFSNLAKKEDSTFHLEVDLPGVSKEDINVNVEEDILIVSAVRKFRNELTRDDYYICESSFGKIERRYALPDNIDTENIEATYEDGRLVIELQKTQRAKPRSIAIK
jgi:HSP20 family protein